MLGLLDPRTSQPVGSRQKVNVLVRLHPKDDEILKPFSAPAEQLCTILRLKTLRTSREARCSCSAGADVGVIPQPSLTC